MSKWSKALRHELAYGLVRSLAFVVNTLPRAMALRVGSGLGTIVHWLAPGLRRVALGNLQRVYEMDGQGAGRMTRQVFRESGRNAVDALRVRKDAAVIDRDTVVAPDTLERVRLCAKEGGALIIGPHLGCWEFLGVLLVRHGIRMLVPATPVRNQRLDSFVREHRLSMGVHTCPRSGSMSTLVEHVQAGGAVGLMMDQDTRVASIPADFLGTVAATPVGPAVLALRTGAPVYCGSLRLGSGDRQELRFDRVRLDDIDLTTQEGLRAATERFNRHMEQHVRERPRQWVWYHRRWRRKIESGPGAMRRASSLVWVICALMACTEPPDRQNSPEIVTAVTPHQAVQAFLLEETHNGAPSWRLRADRARIVRGQDTRLSGMELLFLSDRGDTVSTVVADSGQVPDGTQYLSAYGRVQVRNADGVRVFSDSLRYVRDDDRIRTDAEVEIHRGQDVIRGRGLESDPALEEISIREQVTGQVTPSGESG